MPLLTHETNLHSKISFTKDQILHCSSDWSQMTLSGLPRTSYGSESVSSSQHVLVQKDEGVDKWIQVHCLRHMACSSLITKLIASS